ncbi:MAG: hypothetical protein AAFY90_04910 [Pseudomonadota bacterium]
MTVSDGFYSRFVFWLKVLLPLIALGILSTLFFLARAPDADREIPYATSPGGVPITPNDLIADPSFVGVSPDGAALSFRASTVTPRDAALSALVARDLRSRIETVDGRSVDTVSEAGVIDLEAQLAEFEGVVELRTSDGFAIGARDITARLDRVDIKTDNPIQAVTPLGSLNAGSMQVTAGEEGRYVLVFNGGVELIYAPHQDKDP